MEAIIKCPWCTKKVAVSAKGCIESHLGPGGVKCPGVGVDIHQISEMSEALKQVKNGKKVVNR